MLRELHANGITLRSAAEFESALLTMNRAAHGVNVEPDAAERASQVGARFLDDLRKLVDPQM